VISADKGSYLRVGNHLIERNGGTAVEVGGAFANRTETMLH
jgi:hypothetical protein